MKTKTLVLLLSALFVMSGCGKADDPVYPITTTTNTVWINDGIVQTNRLLITGGNGDYRIIYPRKVTLYSAGSGSREVDFSEDIVKIRIKDGREVVTELTYTEKDNMAMDEYFMIVDARDAKRVIRLLCSSRRESIIGNIPDDLEVILGRMAANKDYWQEYPE